MQITATILSALALTGSALAAPAVSATTTQWTILGMHRPCNNGDTSCTWSFTINRNDGSAATPCSFEVKGNPASRTNVVDPGVTCGVYTITTGWDGHWGEGNGFTTFAVKDYNKHLIAFPAYEDKLLANGATIFPDRTYAVQSI